MPTFNAIQSSRVEKFLKELLGIRNGGICPTVAPELGVELELPQEMDTYLPFGYEPFGAGGSVPLVAAQNSYVTAINNFPDALVIMRFGVSGSATSAYDIAVTGAAGGAPGGANPPASHYGWRDSRRLSDTFAAAPFGFILAEGNAALASPPAGLFRAWYGVVAVNGWQLSPWFVMGRYQSATLVQATVNLTLNYSVEGFIKHVDPDELNV